MSMLFSHCVRGFALLFLVSTAASGGTFGFSWGDDQPAESQSTVEARKSGPPPHAPAHGYRLKHQYRYYPSASVYYDDNRGLYFYAGGSGWRVSASLPQDLRIRLGSAVLIEIDSDKPYLYNDQHRQQYPPGKIKKSVKGHGKHWAEKKS